MEKKIKKVVDSIIEVAYASETYSFKENPTLISTILLGIWEQMEGFVHTDFPNGLRNKWKKLVSIESIEDNPNLLQEVEELINLAIERDSITLLQIISDFSLRLDLDNLELILDVMRLLALWKTLEDCNEYSFLGNPTPVIKMLVEQYFERNSKQVDELPDTLRNKWNTICESSRGGGV